MTTASSAVAYWESRSERALRMASSRPLPPCARKQTRPGPKPVIPDQGLGPIIRRERDAGATLDMLSQRHRISIQRVYRLLRAYPRPTHLHA